VSQQRLKAAIRRAQVECGYAVGVSDASPDPPHHSWVYRRIVLPILALLRMGATPERLAWSIAVGAVIGVNPVVGTTTVLCLGMAVLLRLNIVAAQIANHAVFPLELALVIPFIRLGARVFRTSAMPITTSVFLQDARSSPIALVRLVWMWEWHAVVVWIVFAAMAAPLIALTLTPVLVRVQRRIQRHQHPFVP
jgi:uncharacterized protein (DUF2062 family)